jgi:hypothetical protein
MGRRIGEPRTYTDAHGTAWRVSEHEAGDEVGPARRGQRFLLFESGSLAWRLWTYPPDWRELPDERLAALGWRT